MTANELRMNANGCESMRMVANPCEWVRIRANGCEWSNTANERRIIANL